MVYFFVRFASEGWDAACGERRALGPATTKASTNDTASAAITSSMR